MGCVSYKDFAPMMLIGLMNALPHPGLLPKEKENRSPLTKIRAAGFAGHVFAKPETDNGCPSPGGEGQAEGERQNHLHPVPD